VFLSFFSQLAPLTSCAMKKKYFVIGVYTFILFRGNVQHLSWSLCWFSPSYCVKSTRKWFTCRPRSKAMSE